MCVREREREREREASSHAVCSGIKRFLLRSDELCVAALAAFGGGGHYKELIVGEFGVVGIICVYKSPQGGLFLDPEQTQCCFVVAILDSGICSSTAVAFSFPALSVMILPPSGRWRSPSSSLVVRLLLPPPLLSIFRSFRLWWRPRFPRQLWRCPPRLLLLLLLLLRRRLNPSCPRSGGQTLSAIQ